ncbi:hypothetical protein IHE44_0002130 [Lamprotornis superbus]|uniref:Uncharacterized protein n=1 Tax=Lamprotornis superbus TaxID=245042 RepID=A0A835NJY9_9PASS|nr:hypothetical protein IHE44_0002130 [Lamprotornis superbus]
MGWILKVGSSLVKRPRPLENLSRLHSHGNDRIRDVDGFLWGQGKEDDYKFQQNPGDSQCLRQPGQGGLTMEIALPTRTGVKDFCSVALRIAS